MKYIKYRKEYLPTKKKKRKKELVRHTVRD